MRERLTYEIAISSNGDWVPTETRSAMYSREPAEVARSVLERWVIANPDAQTGGERVVIVDDRHPDAQARIEPTLRVQIFRGAKRSHDPEPVAVGYLGHDRRDYTGEQEIRGTRQMWERARNLSSTTKRYARKAIEEHRVETGVVAAASVLLAGYVAARKLRSRKRSA